MPKIEEEWSGEEEVVSSSYMDPSSNGLHCEMESEKVDCDEPTWRINKPSKGPSPSVVRSIFVRDMGTEMTPTAAKSLQRQQPPLKKQLQLQEALYLQAVQLQLNTIMD